MLMNRLNNTKECKHTRLETSAICIGNPTGRASQFLFIFYKTMTKGVFIPEKSFSPFFSLGPVRAHTVLSESEPDPVKHVLVVIWSALIGQ